MTNTKSTWQNRPPGIPVNVPPPSVPLPFFFASMIGLLALGISLLFSAHTSVTDPTNDAVVGSVHFLMLATLSMGILGALHQFIPVITNKASRSQFISRIVFVSFLIGSFSLPLGFTFELEWLVVLGGFFAFIAVLAALINFSKPLFKSSNIQSTGLKLSLLGFLFTACFGVVYVIDRSKNWFDLSGHIVLAHASIGLFSWLGLTYISVSEKLWPMFMLAHVKEKRRYPQIGIYSLFLGTLIFSVSLLFNLFPLQVLSGFMILIGFTTHSISLASHVRRRKRKADLHLAFLITSEIFLVASAVFAFVSVYYELSSTLFANRLVACFITSLAGWLLLTYVGHLHKVVPFVEWASLRSLGISKRNDGKPLLFADLYKAIFAKTTYISLTCGLLLIVVGLASTLFRLIQLGGVLMIVTAITVMFNLSVIPIKLSIKSRLAKNNDTVT